MRTFWLIIGWSSVFGSLGDALLGLYALVLALSDTVMLTVSLDDFLRLQVPVLYWVKQLAVWVMPDAVVSWLFQLPALVYFPARLVMGLAIGWWALKQADKT